MSTPKGSVSVRVIEGRLTLRWRHGKRYYLAIGLPDSPANQVHARKIASMIELDILAGAFDKTLARYRFDDSPKEIPFDRLWGKFVEFKRSRVTARTISTTFDPVAVKVKAFGAIANPQDAERFTAWLQKQVSPSWCKRMLIMLNACYAWGLDQQFVTSNPFKGLASVVKVPPRKPPEPFSREEIGAIIQAFRTDTELCCYSDFVEFLFGTGCRTAEAIGLQWKHLSDDCSQVWIGESLTRGVRKSTKTNRARSFDLTPRLQEMLRDLKPENFDPESLVFTSPSGKAIDDGNFRNRAWKPILTRLEIPYRKPYNTRHTLVSHALDLGMAPATVASLTGHSTEVLYRHYAGAIGKRELPDLCIDFSPKSNATEQFLHIQNFGHRNPDF